MYWQNNGDYVCVRVDRYRKLNVVKEDDRDNIKYSGLYHNFEIFRIREKQIPVDSIEIKGKINHLYCKLKLLKTPFFIQESFQAFAWEPNGQKFCIIYSEGQNKNTAAFHRIINTTPISPGKIELISK
jgi:translation initiation factor 3 subunit B